MKRVSVVLFVFLLMCFLGGNAAAIPFTSTMDWNPNLEISDSYSYTHTLSIDSGSLQSATLDIRHRGNADWSFLGFGEVWFAAGGNNIYIGRLSESEDSWVTDHFVLSQAILDQIVSTSPWSLTVRLLEDTYLTNRLTLDFSTLSGDYTVATPEPATMLLLGSGIAGLMINRRRRKG
jgi:hypothetical protein